MAECDNCKREYDENESWPWCHECMDSWVGAGCPILEPHETEDFE